MKIKVAKDGVETLSRSTKANSASHTNAALKWDSLAEGWKEAGPPSSPSKEDIQNYRRFLLGAIRTVPHPKVMVLGCTPRLRRMLARLDIAVTCVDISRRMLVITSAGGGTRHIGTEKLINENWLRMNLGEHQFAAILGDKVFDNVAFVEWATLRRRIGWHLRPGGSFITRVAPCDADLFESSFTALLARWVLRYKRKDVTCREAASGLWEQALGASTRMVPGPQTLRVFAKEFEALDSRYGNKASAEGQLMREFKRLFGRGFNFEWTAYTLGNVIDALDGDLALMRLSRSRDYAVGLRQPVLEFRAPI